MAENPRQAALKISGTPEDPCGKPVAYLFQRGALSWPFYCLAILMATVLSVASVASVATVANAQQPARTPNLILEIKIEGNVQTTEGEIFSNLSSRVGNSLERKLITRDIKTIFNLGFFQDVLAETEEVEGKGYILRFMVREKPRIASIRVVGNVKVSIKNIFEVMTLQIGGFYNKSLLEANLEKIRSVYRTQGYLKVKLIPEIRPRDEFNYDVTIRVEESSRLYITQIRVKGANVFTELEIKRMLATAEVDCFDWITDSGVFDEDKINSDLRNVVTRYLTRGYIKVFIDTPKITLIHNPEFSKIIVELDISEGEQYTTGKVDISGDIIGIKQKMMDRLQLKTGMPFNVVLRTQDQFRLQGIYQEQGYAFVQIRPDIRVNDKTRIADVTYRIVKNDKAYIGRIEFQGNIETRDYVLRREFEIRENELFNGQKLRKSQQNLLALGYFEPSSLIIERSQREEENILDLSTRVKESQTGTLQAQMAFSEQSGLTLGISVSKGNFLGRGQTLRTTAQLSQRNVKQNISVDFIEPHLFGTDFSSDSTVAARSLEDTSELERGKIEELRIGQGFGYPILSALRINFSFSAVNRVFEELEDATVKLRTFTSSLSYNTVNHPIFPSGGTLLTFSVSQTGGEILGGTTEFRRYRIHYRHFENFGDSNSLILMFRVRLGFLEKVGDNLIPPEERFRIGGINSIRGYKTNEIGGPFGRLEQNLNGVSRIALDENGDPILDFSGNPIFQQVDSRTLGLSETKLEKLKGGGTVERLVNLEFLFPLAGSGVRGVLFYDAGQVNSEGEQYTILKEEKPAFFNLFHSVGGGVRVITPLGVLRFEYGRKLKVREGESPDEFEFTISTLF